MDEIKKIPNKGGVSMLKLAIIVIVLLLIAFGVWYAFGIYFNAGTSLESNAAAVVAVVNGEEIPRADFDKLLIAQKAAFGEPRDDAEKQALQNLVLDILISKTVLLQKVKKSGLSITNEEINARLSQVKDQFSDEQVFEAALSEQGFTKESFRDFLKNDLLVQNYINSQIDFGSVAVSDEEIKNEYDLAAAKQDNLPELEELSGSIKAQLLQQKQQQLVSDFINKLKKKSDIKIFLE